MASKADLAKQQATDKGRGISFIGERKRGEIKYN